MKESNSINLVKQYAEKFSLKVINEYLYTYTYFYIENFIKEKGTFATFSNEEYLKNG